MNSRCALWIVLVALVWGSPTLAQTIVTIISPTNGTHFAKAADLELNVTLQAQVSNPGPGGVTVYFYANGALVATASSLRGYSTTWSNVAPGNYMLVAGAEAGLPTSNPVTIQVDTYGVALVSGQSIWKYLDGGANPATNWFRPEADLGVWPSGLPQFGFGESDERTIVNFLNQTGGIFPTIYVTYYFHHAFAATNAAANSNLVLRLLRDDGAIVYLNGQEIIRENMPSGPVDYLTYASAGAGPENVFDDHWINPTLLLDGTNHLAVEIHNQGPHSEDISFDLRLVANLPVPPPRLTLTRAGTNLVAAWPRSYLGYRFEATAQLGGGIWAPVTNVATGITEFRSTNSVTDPARFFRLSL